MNKADRLRSKMLRGLVRALDNEEAHVRRYKRLGNACAIAAGVVLCFAAWGGSNASDLWLVAAGAVGGILVGMGLFFVTSVEQWPVTREFLDVDRVREAAGRDER